MKFAKKLIFFELRRHYILGVIKDENTELCDEVPDYCDEQTWDDHVEAN